MASDTNKIISLTEKVVIAAVILVLFHTLIQDIADLFQWSWNARRALIYAGLFFDLLFTIEFALRTLSAIVKKNLVSYLRDDRGWVDFVASVPLLIFSSGPAAISAYNNVPTVATAAGVFGVLKIVKAIRIARVLRLLRLLKIFKHIKHTESIMAQRHLTRIATTIVTTIVVILVGFGLLSSVFNLPDIERLFEEYTVSALSDQIDNEMSSEDIRVLVELRPDVLLIKEGLRTVYSRLSDAEYERYYGPSDYTLVSFPEHNVEVYVDLLPILSNGARHDILHFILIISMILVTLFLYGPHFASTISDPVQIMSRGFKEKGHGLQVVVSERYRGDEIYDLAAKYNDVFLPLKDRTESGLSEGSVVDLSLEDVKKFIDE